MNAAAGSPKPIVLVVDDESLIRWSLRERLRAAGYTVLEAETGLEAVAVFAGSPVDLMLLDLSLPELDGLGVLELVKRSHPACPVIIMTAYDSPGAAKRATSLGAAHFITKPFDFDRMISLVGSTLTPAGAAPPSPV